MPVLILLAAISVSFPTAGTKLPFLERCYMTGAVPLSVTNVTVQGKAADLYRTGGWITMIDLIEGTNSIEIVAGNDTTNCVFTVAPKPAPGKAAPPSANEYGKLPFASDVSRPHPAGKEPADIKIVLDAGHGGNDPGTKSPHGIGEKVANLQLVREIAKVLGEMGYKTILTREDDSFVKLADRPKKAHAADAECFVSIHHNAPGFSTDPRTVRYHAVYAWNTIGSILAEYINRRMAMTLEGDIPTRGVLQANYLVTRNPEIPSCLVEVDFMTTPEAEEAVFDGIRRRAIAKAIAQGIDEWCRAAD